TICQFFLRGNCKFGSACKFEHPQHPQHAGSANQTYTRPGADLKVGMFTAESIKDDLTSGKERPLWPLTSYGPAKFEPTLLSGLDESPEELRLRAATGAKAGNVNEYLSYESSKIAAAEQTFSNAAGNSFQVFEQASKNSKGTTSTSAFGATSAPSAFGATSAPSAFGSGGTSAFGGASTSKPAFAFGQPGFGKPSTFGQTSTGAFGQAAQSPAIKPASGAFAAFASGNSAFGAGASNASNASSTGGGGFSAFAAKPSAFGAPATGGSVFGQSSFGTAAPASAPSTFGAPTTSAFGAPSSTSAFGAPASASAFGAPRSAFGAPTSTSAFGASNATPVFGTSAPANSNSAFGTQATTSAFGGAPTASTSSAFGAPAPSSVFGQSSGFGALSQPPAQTSAFGTGGSTFSNSSSSNAFVIPLQPLQPFPLSHQQSRPPLAHRRRLRFRRHLPRHLHLVRSSHPHPRAQPSSSLAPKSGPPPPPDFRNVKVTFKPGLTPYDSQLPADYLANLPEHVVAAFRADRFEWGKVPDWVPPLELR
ncbi:hypothetical protein GGX14DRAFT_429278, partial [Mycena pura]